MRSPKQPPHCSVDLLQPLLVTKFPPSFVKNESNPYGGYTNALSTYYHRGCVVACYVTTKFVKNETIHQGYTIITTQPGAPTDPTVVENMNHTATPCITHFSSDQFHHQPQLPTRPIGTVGKPTTLELFSCL